MRGRSARWKPASANVRDPPFADVANVRSVTGALDVWTLSDARIARNPLRAFGTDDSVASPGGLFLWVKFIEAVAQLRLRALRRLIWNPDPKIRHAMRRCYRKEPRGPVLEDFRGAPQAHEEEALIPARKPPAHSEAIVG